MRITTGAVPTTPEQRSTRSSALSTSLLKEIARWWQQPPRATPRDYALLLITPETVTVSDWAIGDPLETTARLVIALPPHRTARYIAEYLRSNAVDIHIAAASMCVDERQDVRLTAEGGRAVARLRAIAKGA